MKIKITIVLTLLIFAGCRTVTQIDLLPEVPEGVEAISLLDSLLYSIEPSKDLLLKYEDSRTEYEMDSTNPDKLIWFGRWTAYKGHYREAIRLFSEGITLFPDDARMYRHRGHRYITIRAFNRAISDLEHAVDLIEGNKDSIEPDGMPNALDIPISTLHTNTWYHLGLAYYLNNDLERALYAYQKGRDAGNNEDNLVSTTHWIYMILRRLGRPVEAEAALEPIHTSMEIIENDSYYKLCLFYKGLLETEEIMGSLDEGSAGDAIKYGLGNWYFYNQQPEIAKDIFMSIVKEGMWASFGFIAAEADLALNQE